MPRVNWLQLLQDGEVERFNQLRKVHPDIDIDLSESELSEIDSLGGVDCSNMFLSGCHFSNVVLTGAIFSNADLKGAVFTNCNLFGANFSRANLAGAVFFWSPLDERTLFTDAFFGNTFIVAADQKTYNFLVNHEDNGVQEALLNMHLVVTLFTGLQSSEGHITVH